MPPVQVDEATMHSVRSLNYPRRGVMELDQMLTGAPIGKKGQRCACAAVAMAVDAETGMVLAPDVSDSRVTAADAMARVFLKAVQSSRTLPKEVKVRNQRLKDCLSPWMEFFGVAVRVSARLPAVDRARSSLLNFLLGGFSGR